MTMTVCPLCMLFIFYSSPHFTGLSVLIMRIRNYGPVKEAEIEFGDVTLFMGLPNTGKSYTLKAFHASLALLDEYVYERIVNRISMEDPLTYLWDGLEHTQSSDNKVRIKFKVKSLLDFVSNVIKDYFTTLLPTLGLFEPSIEELYSIDQNTLERVVALCETTPLKVELKLDGLIGLEDTGCGPSRTILRVSSSYTEGEVVLEGTIEELHYEGDQSCRADVIESALKMILYNYLHCIAIRILEEMRDRLRRKVNVEKLVYVPYGKQTLLTLLESAPQKVGELGELLPLNVASALNALARGRSKVLRGELLEKEKLLLRASVPLLQGKLVGSRETLYYSDWRNVSVRLTDSSALAGEISSLLLELLSAMPSSVLALIEEPESQLHPSAQVLMSLLLVALRSLSIKSVVTTHSDLIALTLAELYVHRPNEEELQELIHKMSLVSEGSKELSKLVSKALRSFKLKIYSFNAEGKVEEVGPESILDKEIPSITKVLDELTEWVAGL